MKYSIKYLFIFLLSMHFFSRASMNSSEFLECIKKSGNTAAIPTPILLKKNPLSDNETLLHRACSQGCLDIITEIFSRKDIYPSTLLFIQDGSGYLPLDRAIENDHVEIIKFLLNTNEKYSPQPLLLIFHKNHKNRGTSLHHAIRNGKLKPVELLLEYAQKYNHVEKLLFTEQLGNITPLHLSVLCGFPEITKTLLMQAGRYAFLLASTYNNRVFQDEITPIHDAIKKEDGEMLKVFIDTLGIDVLKISNKKGITALEYAKALNSKVINNMLTMYQ